MRIMDQLTSDIMSMNALLMIGHAKSDQIKRELLEIDTILQVANQSAQRAGTNPYDVMGRMVQASLDHAAAKLVTLRANIKKTWPAQVALWRIDLGE